MQQTRQQIVEYITANLPSIQKKFLLLIEKERIKYIHKLITYPFLNDVYSMERSEYPLKWWYRVDGKSNLDLKNKSSILFLLNLFPFGSIDNIGFSCPGRKEKIALKNWEADSWKGYFAYYNIDRSLETQYYIYTKINNVWHRIVLSTINKPYISQYQKPNNF